MDSREISRMLLPALFRLPSPIKQIAFSIALSHYPVKVEKIGDTFVEYLFGQCNVIVGRATYGHVRVLCWDGDSTVRVGNYTSIGSVTILVGGSHHYLGVSTYPFKARYANTKEAATVSRRGVTIGSDVWIGHDVTILDGRQIDDGAVIGAGSIVADDVPPYAIAVGNPARVRRFRFNEKEIEMLKEIKWWDLPESVIRKNTDLFYIKDVSEFAAKIQEARTG